MTTRNDGPLNNGQEVEPHPTHSIEWRLCDKRPTTITCNKAGTVEDLLNQSSLFRETAENLKRKELVIVRDGKAISSHFPCSLIKNERLTVKYVKASDKLKRPVTASAHSRRTGSSQELVMFHVLVKGGKNIVKLMRNPALKTKVQEVTVYAYKGEKVKYALRRDGRFLNTIFKKACALSNISTEVNTEMSNLVDDLEGKTFQIILLNKSSLPYSQPGIMDEVYMNESQQSDYGEPSSQQPTTSQSAADIMKCQPKTEKNISQPRSARLKNSLNQQFEKFVKTKKVRVPTLSRIQNLFRVEYGQNAQICREVKRMKRLMELSSSVCHVRINETPLGSGFLLCGNFVLTNGHVIKDVYNENSRQFTESVTVHFSFESLADTGEGQVEVEEVVGFEYVPDGVGCDWALLRLRTEQELPVGLWTYSELVPQSGGICIIGHPDGGVKKIDPCVIVTSDNRKQVVEKHFYENQEHIQLVTSRFFESVAESVQQNKQVLTYESSFYSGSSGSPVFDGNCKVVAMHSGGYAYRSTRGETRSVIEFGHPLSAVVERILLQLVETERFDVLITFLTSYKWDEVCWLYIKKLLFEKGKLIAFEKAVGPEHAELK